MGLDENGREAVAEAAGTSGKAAGHEVSGNTNSDTRATNKGPKAAEREAPVWQAISGLTPAAEGKMSRSERRLALRKLFKRYEQMLREALSEHEGDAEKAERSFLWDPIPMICVELGIARRKLSALTKELTGMAAHEVLDKIRAENVPQRMEEALTDFFRQKCVPGKSHDGGWRILWERLRKFRCEPHFDRVSLALGYGFSNFARFRRGCMLAHGGRTPQQLELQIIENLGEYYTVASALWHRRRLISENQWVWVALNEGTNWKDEWSEAARSRPEWLAAMKEKLGLNAELEAFTGEVVPGFTDPRLKAACERERAAQARQQ